ncbi:MAG: nitroreductase family protein, partial [Plesiomonas shigelloides]
MDIAQIALSRYSTKSFDPNRKIPAEQMAQLATLLRLSPSSTNIQPWHFVIASTDEGKQRIAKSTSGFFSFNEPKIVNASHVVVFCQRWTLADAYLKRVLEKEDADGRFATPEVREQIHKGRSIFVDSHRFNMRDEQHWMEKQLYLALG